MLYCLNYRNSRIKSNNKVLTFMWVWKSLKSVLLSPVQCSDPGHTVAHDCWCCCLCCWSPDVALRASGSNNSPLSCLSWSVVAVMSVTSLVWTDYRSTSFSLLDELSLKTISDPKLQMGRRAFALWENAQKRHWGRFAMNAIWSF